MKEGRKYIVLEEYELTRPDCLKAYTQYTRYIHRPSCVLNTINTWCIFPCTLYTVFNSLKSNMHLNKTN